MRREIALIDVRETRAIWRRAPVFRRASRLQPLRAWPAGAGAKRQRPPGAVRRPATARAERAALRAEALGLQQRGGAGRQGRCLAAAGYTLYAGVNVPSKTFGELRRSGAAYPRLSAAEVAAMREASANVVIVDGRPFAEYSKMNIPGGICRPNGELPLRIRDIVPDPDTTIIVNCAGRTRSIIGAQMLIDFGVPNPVYALENGTQGWFLAGLPLEHGANRRGDEAVHERDVAQLSARATRSGAKPGVEIVTAAAAQSLARRGRPHHLPASTCAVPKSLPLPRCRASPVRRAAS